jgi:hypothetical protein
VLAALTLMLSALVFAGSPAVAAPRPKAPIMPKRVQVGHPMIAKGKVPRKLWWVDLLVLVGGKWYAVGNTKTTRKGVYRIRTKAPTKPGVYTYVVVTSRNPGVPRLITQPRRVTVYAPRSH